MYKSKLIIKPVYRYFLILCLFSITAAMANPPIFSSQQRHYKPCSISQEEIIEVLPLQKNQECVVSNDGTYPASISIPCAINLDTNRYDPLFFELEAEVFTTDLGGLISISDNDCPLDVFPNIFISIVNNWSKWKSRTNTIQIKDLYNLTFNILPNYSNLVKAKNIILRLHVMPKN